MLEEMTPHPHREPRHRALRQRGRSAEGLIEPLAQVLLRRLPASPERLLFTLRGIRLIASLVVLLRTRAILSARIVPLAHGSQSID
ncbi:hypothetical protein GCM10025760_27630 [Microbacterium yannicii]|uniref:Uncharacterized protein n=1 Tax=Microbacterium yannicii TaxID=671622 RepID=A0ABP9MF16_9MICO